MEAKAFSIYHIFIVTLINVAAASFFTQSQENDFPLIGKRLLPVSTYSEWLSPQRSAYHNDEFVVDHRNLLRHILQQKQELLGRLLGTKGRENFGAIHNAPPLVSSNDADMRDSILTYLNYDEAF